MEYRLIDKAQTIIKLTKKHKSKNIKEKNYMMYNFFFYVILVVDFIMSSH